jgi:DNA-binding FrmR family transcriptional regulator
MMVDAKAILDDCPNCRDIVTHLQALRGMVRPAKRLGEAAEEHLGAFLMAKSDKEHEAAAQELIALCHGLRVHLAKIIASAQVPRREPGEDDDSDGLEVPVK